MKEVSLMVTDETAQFLERLADKGRITSRSKHRKAYEAYCLALMSRPVKGERWIRVGNRFWQRLPERLSFSG